jgi:hypothetical protein
VVPQLDWRTNVTWEVASDSQLFINLDWKDVEELYRFCSSIVQDGNGGLIHPAFISWCVACRYDERERLSVFTGRFPQKALLSVADHLLKDHPKRTHNDMRKQVKEKFANGPLRLVVEEKDRCKATHWNDDLKIRMRCIKTKRHDAFGVPTKHLDGTEEW